MDGFDQTVNVKVRLVALRLPAYILFHLILNKFKTIWSLFGKKFNDNLII